MDRLPSADLMQSITLAQVPVRTFHSAPSSNVLLAAWRRPGLVCLLTAASLGAGGLALSVLPQKYVADAVLQLNLDKREGGAIEDRGTSVVLDAGAMVQGELRVIRSRAVAHRVVERLGLAQPAEAVPSRVREMLAAAAEAWPAAAQAWRAFREMLPAGPQQPRPAAAVPSETAAEAGVMAGMTAESDNRSYLVTIRYTSDTADKAAAVANALAQEYIARRQEGNVEAAMKTVAWLDEQIRTTSGLLQAADATADDYRAQTGLLELGGAETLGQQRLRDLAAQRSAAVQARSDAQARLGRVQDAVRTGGAPSADDMSGSPQVRSLIERRTEARVRLATVMTDLGPRHPLAIQAQAVVSAAEIALGVELRHALASLQAAFDTASRAELEVSGRFEAAQKSSIEAKRVEAELRARQTASQGLRDRLGVLTRARDQQLAIEQLRPVAATLIVPAEPPAGPVSPKPVVVFPLAGAGGLGLGVLLAAFLERRDRGFRTGAEVEPALGKRCLGMVPEAPRALRPRPGFRSGARSAFEASLMAETVRSVGAALGLFDVAGNCRVVLVTSSLGNEGKSVFCRALADALVASGRQVLLVDGSPRRTALDPERNDADHDAPAARPGLTVLRRSESGSIASDVFGTPEFGRVLERTRKHFDLVILEGPAVMLVADSLVLGRLADSVIHVARWSGTPRATVAAALNRLHESAIAVDGVVLTRVDLARHAALKTIDLGSHYLKERRFYEQLLRPGPPRKTRSSPEA